MLHFALWEYDPSAPSAKGRLFAVLECEEQHLDELIKQLAEELGKDPEYIKYGVIRTYKQELKPTLAFK